MKIDKNQDVVLKDFSATGKERPWGEHKVKNELLSFAYQDINVKKANRLIDCASVISFSEKQDGSRKLKTANFCRVRLCPMCSWRRSLKIFSQMNKIMQALEYDNEYAYLFVTFTLKNCKGEELAETLDSMIYAYKKLTQQKAFKSAVKGSYRSLEITHNLDAETFHPHFHCVFVVNKSYFKKKEYLSHDQWVAMWQKALDVDYTPVVNVKKIKGNTIEAVCEAVKYAVKVDDYIIPDDWDLTVQTVELLDKVLNKRRFVAFGGIMKVYHKMLSLDDVEDGDLVHIDGQNEESTVDTKEIFYTWSSGYRQYRRSE